MEPDLPRAPVTWDQIEKRADELARQLCAEADKLARHRPAPVARPSSTQRLRTPS